MSKCNCQDLLQVRGVYNFLFYLPRVCSSQALAPLCEDDNQSMDIIQRLQKNLDILIQAMTRVSSRSEMLGAIHQVQYNLNCVLCPPLLTF